MCSCNKNNLGNVQPLLEYEQEKVISPLPRKSMLEGLSGVESISLIDLIVWTGMFYAGHKFGKHLFGK